MELTNWILSFMKAHVGQYLEKLRELIAETKLVIEERGESCSDEQV